MYPSLLVELSSRAQFPVISVFSLKTGFFRWHLPNLTLVQCNKDTLSPSPWLAASALGIFTHRLMDELA